MRNLKKILALVLALVMSFSVMTVSSAAFKDEAKISDAYAESIEVLNAIGVFRGDENGKFNPQKNITRAEVAAIIYRITTGDVEDAQAGFYADLNMFTDVTADDWFAGYVNYCASAEFIKGRGDGTFDPQDSITGYDALTMILRAIGYDQNGEFTGEGYTVKVAQIAKERGITDTLKNVALGTAATREVVAEILFNTINVAQVSYTLAFGYSIYVNPLQQDGSAAENETLGYENFGLCYSGELDYNDWGVPFNYGWFCDVDGDKAYGYWEEVYGTLITTEEYTPVYESFEATYECDVAKAMGLTKDTTVTSVKLNATKDEFKGVFDGVIEPLATKEVFGAQGRWTRIFLTDNGYEVVMMDQFLAQVVEVTEITYDRNGHVKAPATVTLNVYDATWDVINGDETQISWESKTGNFDYVVGQTILLYHQATIGSEVVASDIYEVIGAPKTLTGKQTAYVIKSNSHIVEGTEYDDAVQFNLDQCGLNTQSNWTWFFDTHGNLIASMAIPAEDNTQYGVITAIKWVDEYNTLSYGYALASIVYMDGTSATVKVGSINGEELVGTESYGSAIFPKYVSSSMQYNDDAGFTYTRLYTIVTDGYGYAHLVEATRAYDVETATNVSKLGYSGFYATHNTQFLVLTDDGFETYTGIQEIPSYSECAIAWVVDADENNVAEYVYIIDPTLYGWSEYTNGTFFSFVDDKLTVKHTLYKNNELLYTVSGGLVDGEVGAFSTFNPSIVAFVEANQGKLLKLEYTDGYVTGAAYVTDVYTSDTPDGYSAIYAGSAANAYIEGNVLFTDAGAFDISDVEVISEYRNLEDTLFFAHKTGAAYEAAYLYVIYTYTLSHEYAVTVYISNVPGVYCSTIQNSVIGAFTAAQGDITDVEFTYAVDADVDVSMAINAFAQELYANEEIAYWAALGADIRITTEFEYTEGAAETNEITFKVVVAYDYLRSSNGWNYYTVYRTFYFTVDVTGTVEVAE